MPPYPYPCEGEPGSTLTRAALPRPLQEATAGPDGRGGQPGEPRQRGEHRDRELVGGGAAVHAHGRRTEHVAGRRRRRQRRATTAVRHARRRQPEQRPPAQTRRRRRRRRQQGRRQGWRWLQRTQVLDTCARVNGVEEAGSSQSSFERWIRCSQRFYGGEEMEPELDPVHENSLPV